MTAPPSRVSAVTVGQDQERRWTDGGEACLKRQKRADYSVLCVRLVLMRLSRLPPMKVLSTQRLQSLQSASKYDRSGDFGKYHRVSLTTDKSENK